jgi:hypothetical protein
MLQASSKSRKGTDCCEELWRRLAPVVSSAEGDESKSDDDLIRQEWTSCSCLDLCTGHPATTVVLPIAADVRPVASACASGVREEASNACVAALQNRCLAVVTRFPSIAGRSLFVTLLDAEWGD